MRMQSAARLLPMFLISYTLNNILAHNACSFQVGSVYSIVRYTDFLRVAATTGSGGNGARS